MKFSTTAWNRPEPATHIVTGEGWARSGKGTTLSHLEGHLGERGKSVELIDQGIKFRAMAAVAIAAGRSLDSPTVLNAFLGSPEAQKSMLTVLGEVASMDDAAKKDRLYTPELSRASGKVGKVSSSHEVAVRLLRSQVATAAVPRSRLGLRCWHGG